MQHTYSLVEILRHDRNNVYYFIGVEKKNLILLMGHHAGLRIAHCQLISERSLYGQMKIDCHVHLVGASPKSGCYLSPRMLRAVSTRFLLLKNGLSRIKDPSEQEWAYINNLRQIVKESEIDRAVLLGFDGVYGADGELDRAKTHVYVPNAFVLDVCRRHPDTFLFGASVHPYRKDALDVLEQVASEGAVLVKLLPNSQGFDPADPKLIPFYRKLGDLGLILLCHAGYEHTIPVINQSYGNPTRLTLALEQGINVIVAHSGTSGLMHFKETFGAFLALIAKYPNCYGDTSALTNFWRSKYLIQLLNPKRLERLYNVQLDEPMRHLIHGSDYPIPTTPFAFHLHLTADNRKKVRKIANPLQQDIELKRILGVPDACLTRAYQTLGIGQNSD